MRLTGFVLSFFLGACWCARPQTTGAATASATNYFFAVRQFVSGNVNLSTWCARVYTLVCVCAGVRIWSHLSESMNYSLRFSPGLAATSARGFACLVCTVWGRRVRRVSVRGWAALMLGELSRGPLLGEAERGEMTCCQSELTVTAQCFSASWHFLFTAWRPQRLRHAKGFRLLIEP